MKRPHPDHRDLVLAGSSVPATGPKAGRGTVKTLLLAGVALLSSGWGIASIVFFARKELSVPRHTSPDFGVMRPNFGAKIDLEHFQHIRMGMKMEEVESLLGGPPGFYESTEGFEYLSPSRPRIDGKGRDGGFTWYGRTSCITILLGDAGTVIDQEYCLGKRIR